MSPTRFGRLFTGAAAERPAFIPESIEGLEGIRPDDTNDLTTAVCLTPPSAA